MNGSKISHHKGQLTINVDNREYVKVILVNNSLDGTIGRILGDEFFRYVLKSLPRMVC